MWYDNVKITIIMNLNGNLDKYIKLKKVQIRTNMLKEKDDL